MLKKKGLGFGDLPMYAIFFVVIAITLSVGSGVLEDVATDNRVNDTGGVGYTCNATEDYGCGSAYNATRYGLQGMNKLAKYQPQFGNVIALAIIIAILFMAFSSIKG